MTYKKAGLFWSSQPVIVQSQVSFWSESIDNIQLYHISHEYTFTWGIESEFDQLTQFFLPNFLNQNHEVVA